MKEIILGDGGHWISNLAADGGLKGVLIRKSDKQHEIDTPDPDAIPNAEFVPQENDVVIYCVNLQSARVLQDRVNILCLAFNKDWFTDKKEKTP